MFGRSMLINMVNRSATNEADRRSFLRGAGLTGLGVLGAGALGTMGAGSADAAEVGDLTVLNFALNLEYLEAEFYSHAVTGHGLASKDIHGTGKLGGVTGGRRVNFKTPTIAQYAREIANDEVAHVKFLRAALDGAAVSRPTINIQESFTAAARAARLIGKNETFDPYLNETTFLLAAFIFEDVGVTAYKGAAPLITNKAYLEAAAGILAVEAYHASTIRTTLYNMGLGGAANQISTARDSLDGKVDLDQGPLQGGVANIQPTDRNGVAFSRSPGQVLNVVYLSPKSVNKGGFFPDGVNGDVTVSAGS